jgi:ubiquitin-like 1-activating enzyme E1 B
MSSPEIPPILAGLRSALPPPLLSQILTSPVLLIGSGGIGCELLKNLALSGFRRLDVIDLDTIDVSNLNRQFLFRARHVGMPKCVVASEAASSMVPPLTNDEAKYTPHHGNVLDNDKFNVPYVQQFALVLNALDNVSARRRVNRLCLAAGVPLIEAGTAGYLGQVTVIDKNAGVECYECQVKATQKVYPICTIRSTPSMPVHCIVWGKELYKLCFGGKGELLVCELLVCLRVGCFVCCS